jgi:hypothetical protein
MSTATQYNPNRDLNSELLAAGLSKTVYALVTPETEGLRAQIQKEDYLAQFREAWTGKQDAYHEAFFTKWVEWSSPVVDLDRSKFPFYYPTAGASEAIRQIIFTHKSRYPKAVIHFFAGEYEGYKAMAEASLMEWREHHRENWRMMFEPETGTRGNPERMRQHDLFFISQPSAIDGMVWDEFNEFVAMMPAESVVADVTYVGAVPESAVREKFNLTDAAIHSVVFSLSKPFGAYYDRIGGVFCREEDPALFGNRWFKNLTSIRYGTLLMNNLSVFDLPHRYARVQQQAIKAAQQTIDAFIKPSDVYILGYNVEPTDTDLGRYLLRDRTLRVCLTPLMADQIGTGSPRQSEEDVSTAWQAVSGFPGTTF